MQECETIDLCTVFGFWPKRNVNSSIENLLDIKKQAEVDKVVSLSAGGIFYDFIEGNDETFNMAEKHKDDIIPAMTINLARYFDCYEEIDRCMEKGFRILRLFPAYQEWDVSQAPFKRLLKLLKDRYLPIILPAETGITAIGNIAGEISSPIIIEGFRYCNLAEIIAVMQKHRNVYAETHLINSPDGIEVLTGETGPDRVVFGSNFPLHYMLSGALPVRNSRLKEDEKRKILGENIKTILRL